MNQVSFQVSYDTQKIYLKKEEEGKVLTAEFSKHEAILLLSYLQPLKYYAAQYQNQNPLFFLIWDRQAQSSFKNYINHSECKEVYESQKIQLENLIHSIWNRAKNYLQDKLNGLDVQDEIQCEKLVNEYENSQQKKIFGKLFTSRQSSLLVEWTTSIEKLNLKNLPQTIAKTRSFKTLR